MNSFLSGKFKGEHYTPSTRDPIWHLISRIQGETPKFLQLFFNLRNLTPPAVTQNRYNGRALRKTNQRSGLLTTPDLSIIYFVCPDWCRLTLSVRPSQEISFA
jgi:hypothetical protein